MGKIKRSKKDHKSHILTEVEFNYLKILNTALAFNTLKDKLMSGFLYYVCNARLGYNEKDNLIFEIDLEDDKRELKIRDVPKEVIEQAKQQVDPHPKPE